MLYYSLGSQAGVVNINHTYVANKKTKQKFSCHTHFGGWFSIWTEANSHMNADSEEIDNRGYEFKGIGVRIIMQNDAISFILSRL